ncbi:sensor histidine kinase [Cryptosporangium sp. NPDC048952]|uniref:sensor histidine kinase n=1 Tax=Cryptosporangium sp. NPDC048952 TaxID=3363961 RepID=UPI003721BBB5
MGEAIESPRLPKPVGAVRAFWARHPRLVDASLVLLCAVWSFDTGDGITVPQPVDGAWLAVNLTVSVTMLLRRSRPWWTLLAVTVGGAVMSDHFIGVALACALYALAAYRSTRDAVLGAVLATIVLLAAGSPDDLRGTVIGLVAIAVIAVLPGANARIRRSYLQALLDRTAQLAREKEQEGQLAAARERTRIAADLHDIVAHSLTVMVRLADGAAAVTDSDPRRATSASERIADIGRDAMTDMRRLLGVLREDPPDEQPSQDLDALVATFRAAGLPVDVRSQGEEPASPSLRNAIFRAVQESLTNALRYAEDPQRVLVDIDYRDDPILIAVTDDGRSVGPAPSVGSQQGLNGLAERLLLYGGTVDAGPRSPHGWAVQVTLPQHAKETDG